MDWPASKIRQTFLNYFEERGHKVVRSSSLVPANDPTLLFTNAGMNQFKDVFLGLEQRDYRRAASCQKCLRAGGKHNDLENVGFTNRHHTFFEMLGNFSFGDYFKKEAVDFAWELTASPQWFAIPKEKLYVTIFKGEEGIARDAEAYEHWLRQGVAAERIFESGLKENFWAMGDTGPCGPCSEIHYDMGPAASDRGHKDCKFPCDCGRFVEIWNLVFMQFNRDASGRLNPLPKPSVDTGAGLERLAAVLQGKISNFDTDLFTPLMDKAAELCHADRHKYENQPSLRIIADHSRAATFLIADEVVPSNEGRGYVLRKIIRRALRHAQLIGARFPFMSEMSLAVREEMRGAYPELYEASRRTIQILNAEEQRFSRTLEIGAKKLDEEISPLLQLAKDNPGQPFTFLGDKAFKLYDTYGLPLDFIQDVVRDSGLFLDADGFAAAMNSRRARARASWKGAHKEVASPVYAKLAETFTTEPDFYFGTTTRDCRIEAIVTQNGEAKELKAGEEGEVVLDRSTIYAESGGQVADTGSFLDNNLSLEVAEVRGAYYPVTGLIAHRILARENLRLGDRVATVADALRRGRVMRNHTATHLVHAALRNILGAHVKQSGSLNAPDHLRFDFSHFAALDPGELAEIEQQVNEEILRNLEIQTDIMTLDDALQSGALAFFGDKYPGQNVRVVTIPDPNLPAGFYSKELCGGTHVGHTGEIGVFKIVSEQSTAAGIRRVEALTGDGALAEYQQAIASLRAVAALLNVPEEKVAEGVERLAETVKQLEKQLDALKRKTATSLADSLLAESRTVKDVRVVAANVVGLDRASLRQLADALRQKMGSGVVVLASAEDGKVSLITAVTKDLTPKLHAGKIIQELAKRVGGTGGGRPDLAEAGGRDVAGLETALLQVYPLVERML